GVAAEDAGLASGLLNTSRIVGAAIGLAILSTVAADRTSALLEGAASTPARVAAVFTGGYANGLVVAAGIMVAALIAAMFIPPLRRSQATQSAEAEIIQLQSEQVESELESA